MQRRKYISFLSCLVVMAALCTKAGAQGYVLPYEIVNGDTLYIVNVKPITIYPLPKPNTKDWKEYRRLVYNFKKVYPYALAAKERMDRIDETLSKIKKSKERDKLVAKYEKELFNEFEKPIRNLTFSQGKLLLKLVDREVGQTSYYVIRDLKGTFTAFFWQGIARLFGADLKKPYDKYGEDREVEKLVRMYQDGSFSVLCAQLGV